MAAHSSPSASTACLISAAHCRLFVRYLRSRDLDPARPLACVALAESELDYDLLLPIDRYLQFLRACAEATNDPDLGLHAGALFNLDELDLVGLLMRSAPMGQQAWEIVKRHQHKWGGDRDTCLAVEGQHLRCTQIRVTRHPTPRVLGEYFVARTVTLGRAVNANAQPLLVRFMHPRPECLDEHRRLFGPAQLMFGEADTEVRFSASLLERPQSHADAVVAQIVSKHVEAMPPEPAQRTDHLPSRVRTIVAEHLATGEVSLSTIARRLYQSERTLRRQLHACGTSYQAIVDDVRHQLAIRYLDAGLSPAEVSAQLGFREPATIYRAFRRWTGKPLSESRVAARSQGGGPTGDGEA